MADISDYYMTNEKWCDLTTSSCVTGNSFAFGDDRQSSVALLRELCTDATSEQIQQSLNRHNGDANIAAQELLDMSQDTLGYSKDCQNVTMS